MSACDSKKCSRCGLSKPGCQLSGGVCSSCLDNNSNFAEVKQVMQHSNCEWTKGQLELIQTKIQCVIAHGFQNKIGVSPDQCTQYLSMVNNLLRSGSYCQSKIWTNELRSVHSSIIVNTSC